MSFEWADLVTVLVLVVLEGLLSGDNALVLAVIVLPLPEEQQRRALRYGIIGAFVLRVIATFLAVYLARMTWVALLGGLYLFYLPYKHFSRPPDDDGNGAAALATGILGLSLFWTIVIKADLIDLVFAVDSILAAVAITKKTWVIITGGLLGILMMRLLTMQVLELVKRYPKLIDGAYVVVGWIGAKLLWEFLHGVRLPEEAAITPALLLQAVWAHLLGRTLPGHHLLPELRQEVAIGVVLLLFAISFLYARAEAKRRPAGLPARPDGAPFAGEPVPLEEPPAPPTLAAAVAPADPPLPQPPATEREGPAPTSGEGPGSSPPRPGPPARERPAEPANGRPLGAETGPSAAN